MNQTQTIRYYLFLSLVAAILLLLLILSSPSPAQPVTPREKFLISSAFILCCLLGFSLTTHPGWYRRVTRPVAPHPGTGITRAKPIPYHGHHPDCTPFRTHIVIIGNSPRCAGCLGIALGSLLSLLLIISYLLLPPMPLPLSYHHLFFLGLLLLLLTYGENLLLRRNPIVHITLNAVFIVGFFLVVLSVVELTGNILSGFLALLFSFLWVDTRIQLSKWNHVQICQRCIEPCTPV